MKVLLLFILALCSAHADPPVTLVRHQLSPIALLGGPTYIWNRLWGLDCTFRIDGPRQITLIGHLNLVHRKLCVGAVGFALKAYIRGPVQASTQSEADVRLNDLPQVLIYGSKVSGNIANAEAHYAEVPLHGYVVKLEPGWYRTEICGNSHSSASSYSGLIEVNHPTNPPTPDPYNELLVRIEDVTQ